MYCRLLERGTQASTSAVTASTSGANIAYWSLLRGKSGPPTEVGRFVLNPPDGIILDISKVRQQGRLGGYRGAEEFEGPSSICTQSKWHGLV